MSRTPENSAEIGDKSSKINSAVTLSLLALSLGTPIPTEEDCQEIADKFEKNPPADITPEGLVVVLRILRGEKSCL
jgi:hypothetical protein